MLAYVLGVNFLAAVVALATAFTVPVELEDLRLFAVLIVCVWLATELTRHVDRKREYSRLSSVAYVDTKAVWTFAAVIVLPLPLVTLLIIVNYWISWSRVQLISRNNLKHRWVFSCSTVLNGAYAASFVLAHGMSAYPGPPASSAPAAFVDLGVIVVAGLLRWIINAGMVMAAIAISDASRRVRDLFTNFSQQFLELGAYGLGLVVAVILVANPFVLPGVIVAIVVLHRSALVNQYQRASRQDTKTGLASAGWWHEFAEQTLARTDDRGSTMGLLMVDLDHFKRINDTYGHPFGDEVLQAVALELQAEVRDDDACGRWGGEEFAVVLPDVGSEDSLKRVAERIRLRIESLTLQPPGDVGLGDTVNLTASIGGAVYPAKGISTLDELLLAADSALYEAKNSGRNRVCLSPAGPKPVVQEPPGEDLPGIIPPGPSPN
ncbi:diguanylate cyclase [Phytoactinopolyspora sp. XMNu-373]|uniref:Diguanylate cyclase n=1 Tax=Phytoactinopolyspora mesophila TaxID=2650750 RepID=A0A7K3M645_9ACTN|nr:diguanylate cyclase [Phytoactinopolyspora mesophila]